MTRETGLWSVDVDRFFSLLSQDSHRIQMSHIDDSSYSGASIPQQPWRSFPPISRLPPPLSATPPPQTIFWTFYTQFCAILCVFSVNFGSWVRNNDTKKLKNIYKWGWYLIGTAHCMLAFFKVGDKTQSSERSEQENFWENDRKTI